MSNEEKLKLLHREEYLICQEIVNYYCDVEKNFTNETFFKLREKFLNKANEIKNLKKTNDINGTKFNT